MAIFAGRYRFLKKLQANEKSIDKMIWLVTLDNGDDDCVLKCSVNKKLAKEEYDIMRKLDHFNIVEMFEAFDFYFKECQYMAIAMEHMAEGNLDTFIKNKNLEKPINWSEEEALMLIIQLINGLSYLHENGIIHRDLKPSNIFLGADKRLAIGDFGISDTLETTRMTRIVGTDNFLPPEAIEESEQELLTFDRDMWSCGVVVYMISYLIHPFAVPNRMQTMVNICNVKIHPSLFTYERCDSIIDLCLKKNPQERIENACLLAKSHHIENLMYQYENDVCFTDMTFSNEEIDVVKCVNNQLQFDLSRKRDEYADLEDELDRTYEKNDKLRDGIYDLKEKYNRKCQALEASRKSNQEKTKIIKDLEKKISILQSKK